jgi:hypothetical protein
VFTAPAVDRAYRAVAANHGDPAGVLIDDGAVSTGRYRGQGRVALEVTLHHRGVVFCHSRAHHPSADLRQGCLGELDLATVPTAGMRLSRLTTVLITTGCAPRAVPELLPCRGSAGTVVSCPT